MQDKGFQKILKADQEHVLYAINAMGKQKVKQFLMKDNFGSFQLFLFPSVRIRRLSPAEISWNLANLIESRSPLARSPCLPASVAFCGFVKPDRAIFKEEGLCAKQNRPIRCQAMCWSLPIHRRKFGANPNPLLHEQWPIIELQKYCKATQGTLFYNSWKFHTSWKC